MHMKGASGCRQTVTNDPGAQQPSQMFMTWVKTRPQHWKVSALLFYEMCVGSLTSHSYLQQGLWDGTSGLLSLSEKTWKFNHLLMWLQRQHFLLSYFKTLSVGPAGVKLTTSRVTAQCSTTELPEEIAKKWTKMKNTGGARMASRNHCLWLLNKQICRCQGISSLEIGITWAQPLYPK